MRELADAERILRFMRAAGAAAAHEGVCYLAGGSTAVLLGWRRATIDVDIALEPEQDELLRSAATDRCGRGRCGLTGAYVTR